MKRLIAAMALAGVFAAPAANAEFEFKQENLYVGGGLGLSMFDSVAGADVDNGFGYQFFGGYDLEFKIADKIDTAVEVGFQDSGDLEYKTPQTCFTVLGQQSCSGGGTFKGDGATGLWINGVFTYPVDDKIGVLGRIGFDIGDDDGLMFGAGAGYRLTDQISVRGEFVMHDSYKSLEANVVYDF